MDNRNDEKWVDFTPLSPLISASDLKDLLGDPDVLVVDCRFSLDDPGAGRQRWQTSRIPGAFYAHVDHDLSGPVGDGRLGRHPLPDPVRIHALLARWGVTEGSLLVAYDDAGGGFAGRLWWMARWIGHNSVCVLDGGWQAWVASHGEVDTAPLPADDVPLAESGVSEPVFFHADWLVTADDLAQTSLPIVDARARPRFLGEEEPIDRVAGHIPGAVNMPWMENLGPDGRFLSPEALAARWDAVGGSRNAVTYCGSGVTACHNILAAAVAGLPLPRLYAPSWSGWISDPSRPIETGLPGSRGPRASENAGR
ncbi:MAG: sulfurtransferase [Bacteroidetes bacterium]|nr:sulfurtransferase [Bacteroidota bacterium]